MVLIPRRVLVLLVVLFSAAVVGIGVFAYDSILDSGGVDRDERENRAEEVLFVSLVVFAALIVIVFAAAGRTLYVSRELDKLIELSRLGDFSPEASVRKLGRIGEQIAMLYFRLNALNEKKSMKISAMSHLMDFLVANIGIPLFVTDVAGIIVYVSSQYTRRFNTERSEILRTSVSALLDEGSHEEVLMSMERRNVSMERKVNGKKATLIPISNYARQLAYVIWVFENGDLAYDPEGRQEMQRNPSRASNMLRRMFRSRARTTEDGRE